MICVMTEFAPMPRELRTERLRLRWWLPSDSADVRRLWSERDPRSLRLIDVDGHPTENEMRDRISAQLDEGERTGLGMLAIELQSGPGFIGYCGLTVGSATKEEPEIAFELFGRHTVTDTRLRQHKLLLMWRGGRVARGCGRRCANGTRRRSMS